MRNEYFDRIPFAFITSVPDLVASISEVTDCNELNTPRHTSHRKKVKVAI